MGGGRWLAKVLVVVDGEDDDDGSRRSVPGGEEFAEERMGTALSTPSSREG
jgi:hypothetical protein